MMYDDLAVFMSQLVDLDGRPLQVAAHHRVWCTNIMENPRLALLGPRDHSKSTTALVSILWHFFRHAIDPTTGLPRSPNAGNYLAVLFSATEDQARVLLARFRDLMAANDWIFPEVAAAGSRLARPLAASDSQIRLSSGAELLIRAYGTAVRGLHPNLLVLDDVLSDQNSGTEAQRTKTWKFFGSTILPMHPERILVVGTAIHAADLLQRLKPSSAVPGGRVHDFVWKRYRAIDDKTETALWPERHSFEELLRVRDMDPTVFSREYMHDPQDDLSTYFPRDLTQLALHAGASLTMLPFYLPEPHEWIVLGADLARSERMGADYTVAIVAAFNPSTGERRILTIRRERGLDFEAQIALFTDLAISYGVHLAKIEDNGFQAWLLDELRKRPGGDVFFGHTTGRGKWSLDAQGIPILKLALVGRTWVMPSGDATSRTLARIWQAELGAIGWRDGRVVNSGEHDDTLIASWLLEAAVQAILRHVPVDPYEIVWMEDLGIERVKIGEPY